MALPVRGRGVVLDFWFLACWAGAPDTRITGSCHRVAVCAGRPGHEARVVGWSSAFGSIEWGLRACVQLSMDLSPLTVVQFQSLNSDLIKKIKKQILKKKGECANK